MSKISQIYYDGPTVTLEMFQSRFECSAAGAERIAQYICAHYLEDFPEVMAARERLWSKARKELGHKMKRGPQGQLHQVRIQRTQHDQRNG